VAPALEPVQRRFVLERDQRVERGATLDLVGGRIGEHGADALEGFAGPLRMAADHPHRAQTHAATPIALAPVQERLHHRLPDGGLGQVGARRHVRPVGVLLRAPVGTLHPRVVQQHRRAEDLPPIVRVGLGRRERKQGGRGGAVLVGREHPGGGEAGVGRAHGLARLEGLPEVGKELRRQRLVEPERLRQPAEAAGAARDARVRDPREQRLLHLVGGVVDVLGLEVLQAAERSQRDGADVEAGIAQGRLHDREPVLRDQEARARDPDAVSLVRIPHPVLEPREDGGVLLGPDLLGVLAPIGPVDPHPPEEERLAEDPGPADRDGQREQDQHALAGSPGRTVGLGRVGAARSVVMDGVPAGSEFAEYPKAVPGVDRPGLRKLDAREPLDVAEAPSVRGSRPRELVLPEARGVRLDKALAERFPSSPARSSRAGSRTGG
jgi:hypothetical protein